MPNMKRVYYQGDKPYTSEMLPGVLVQPGGAVDVPEKLAAVLVRMSDWAYEPKPITEIRKGPQDRRAALALNHHPLQTFSEVMAQPAERLRGLGRSTRKSLEPRGLSTVGDIADMSDDEIREVAEAVSGVSAQQLETWREDARDRLDAVNPVD